MIKRLFLVVGVLFLSGCSSVTVKEYELEPTPEPTRIVYQIETDPCLQPLKDSAVQYSLEKVTKETLYDIAKTCKDDNYYLQLVWGIEGGDPNIIDRILSW